MARIINNDYYIALECKDLQAKAMSVDCTGTYALLAGRRCIALRNLDEEYENVLKFPRTSKYEVGAAEWNPTSHNKEMCAISTNERLEIFIWRDETLSLAHSLRAHTRAISGLNWHKFDPNILATSSVDTFVNLWDIRDLKKPTLSLANVAESSQVRWNKISQQLFATAHDGDIKIWDQRKGASPLQYISAHLAKIYGLDWSPHIENQIASASQDHTVKFFDTTNPRKADFTLSTGSPVWRARYTPFGNGMVTVVVPQLRRGGENSLLLWNISNRTTPMHTFVGHRDVVLEFQWRPNKTDDANLQLVTWSKDQTLLVWKIEPFLQKLCGYEPEDDMSVYDDNSSSVDEASSTVSSRKTATIQPLQQEFSLLNVHIPNLEVKNMDSVNRTVTVTCRITSFVVTLQATFPHSYPHGIAPIFQILPGSNFSDSLAAQLLQTLNHLAQQRVSKNRTCLEPCLRQMVTMIEQFSVDADSGRTFERVYVEPAVSVGGYNDAYIPFPRTSGAKFCSVNVLVCFGRPILARRWGNKNDTGTPRALSALEGILAKRTNDQMTVSAYYYQKQKQRSRSKHSTLSKNVTSKATVHLYDATNLFLINRQLAEDYILDGDVATICKHNAAAAAVVGRRDLVQAWTIAELTLTKRRDDNAGVWAEHPCGDNLLLSLIKHYASQSDVQMAAMLCCIFGKVLQENASKKAVVQRMTISYGNYPYHVISSADIVADDWAIIKTARSTSLDNLKAEDVTPTSPTDIRIPYLALYEYYKLAYAETLHRWSLLYKRSQVMKCMATRPERYRDTEFVRHCQYCQTPVKGGVCAKCKRAPLKCAVCHVATRGAVNWCVMCGHGGHNDHMEMWFRKKTVCPSCGCHCLFETTYMTGV